MTPKKEVELKECPFCGNENPRFDKVSGAGAPEREHMVTCTDCGAWVKWSVWNTRTKSKLVELDKKELAIFLHELDGHPEWVWLSPNVKQQYFDKAHAICSRFGTKRVDVGRMEKIIRKNGKYEEKFAVGLSDKLTIYPVALAQAIVKELEG